MELKAVEKKKGIMRVEVKGESHTLMNILRENAWKSKAKQASYLIEHPYLSNPVITVRAENPSKVLSDAAQMVANQAMEFQKEFGRLTKKQ